MGISNGNLLNKGIVYIAYGKKAQVEVKQVVKQTRRFVNGITIIDETVFQDSSFGARAAKLNLDILSPYDITLYLDVDTQVNQDISIGFEIIEDGWDIAIVPSGRQGYDVLGHIPEDDRNFTLEYLDTEPLNLQAGVFFFNRLTTKPLFEMWRQEWQKFKQYDQAAFLRALYQCPLKVWTLGNPWNSQGGAIIDHQFGRLKV
jgi:lipopolysaccharide biosynthesis glycosyltransferase